MNGRANCLFLFPLLFAQRISLESDPVSIMDKAVEDGVSDGRIADALEPFRRRDLRHENRRMNLETVLEHFEKRQTAVRIQRLQSEVIEDE